MVKQSFWKDSKSGLLSSFVSTEPFSRRGFFATCNWKPVAIKLVL